MVIAFLVVGVAVYALLDCLRTDATRVRVLPKSLWVVVIVLVILVGPLAWLATGRDRGTGRSVAYEPPPPLAPDDDPAFLRDLDLELWQREQEERDGESDGDDPQRV